MKNTKVFKMGKTKKTKSEINQAYRDKIKADKQQEIMKDYGRQLQMISRIDDAKTIDELLMLAEFLDKSIGDLELQKAIVYLAAIRRAELES